MHLKNHSILNIFELCKIEKEVDDKVIYSNSANKDVKRQNKKETLVQKNRKNILKYAEIVFLEKGFHAASTGEIAERAGVAKKTLFNHFLSKQDLYIGMYDDYLSALENSILRISKLTLPADQLSLKYFEKFHRFAQKNETFMRFFLWQFNPNEFKGHASDQLRNRVNERTAQIYKIVREHLKKSITDDQILNIEPDLVIHVMLAINKGIFMQADSKSRLKQNNISQDTLFKLCKVVIENGLFRKPPNCVQNRQK